MHDTYPRSVKGVKGLHLRRVSFLLPATRCFSYEASLKGFGLPFAPCHVRLSFSSFSTSDDLFQQGREQITEVNENEKSISERTG